MMAKLTGIELEIHEASKKAEFWKAELIRLKGRLAERPDAPPRIAKGLRAWGSYGNLYLVLGSFKNRYGHTRIAARKIKDDGILGPFTSGGAISEDWSNVDECVPDDEAIEIARRYKPQRKWAQQFLKAHGVE